MKDIFCVLIVGCMLLSGCVSEYDAPCRDRVVAKNYVFSDTVETVIPYSSMDTLIYKASTDDSLVLLTQVYLDSVTLNTSDVPNNPDCLNDYESHQTLTVVMADSFSTFTLNYRAVENTGLCKYEWGTEKIELAFQAIMAKDSTYHDSLMLGTNWFYNVHRFTTGSGNQVYIHPSLGLLQFTNNTKTYTLHHFSNKPWR